jgi:hypothetical protein
MASRITITSPRATSVKLIRKSVNVLVILDGMESTQPGLSKSTMDIVSVGIPQFKRSRPI